MSTMCPSQAITKKKKKGDFHILTNNSACKKTKQKNQSICQVYKQWTLSAVNWDVSTSKRTACAQQSRSFVWGLTRWQGIFSGGNGIFEILQMVASYISTLLILGIKMACMAETPELLDTTSHLPLKSVLSTLTAAAFLWDPSLECSLGFSSLLSGVAKVSGNKLWNTSAFPEKKKREKIQRIFNITANVEWWCLRTLLWCTRLFLFILFLVSLV